MMRIMAILGAGLIGGRRVGLVLGSPMKSRTPVAGVFASALAFVFLCGNPTQAAELDTFAGSFSSADGAITATASFTVGINVAAGLAGCEVISCEGGVVSISGTFQGIPDDMSLLSPVAAFRTFGSDDYALVFFNSSTSTFSITPDGDGIAFTALGQDYNLIDPQICDVNSNCTTLTTFSFTDTLATPAPIAGAGLPGLLALAATGLFGWWRKRRNTSAVAG